VLLRGLSPFGVPRSLTTIGSHVIPNYPAPVRGRSGGVARALLAAPEVCAPLDVPPGLGGVVAFGVPMNRFLSTFTMRLDAKGRVSIPAPFRAVLARDGHEGLHCHPGLDRQAVDAGGSALLSEIESLIDRYPPFSEEREEFSAALFGRSETLKPDSEGRIVC
jgi:hypothetical protein